MKQCWISDIKRKNPKNPPFYNILCIGRVFYRALILRYRDRELKILAFYIFSSLYRVICWLQKTCSVSGYLSTGDTSGERVNNTAPLPPPHSSLPHRLFPSTDRTQQQQQQQQQQQLACWPLPPAALSLYPAAAAAAAAAAAVWQNYSDSRAAAAHLQHQSQVDDLKMFLKCGKTR
jgi:hypothetical protein